jgi:plasmid stability protein
MATLYVENVPDELYEALREQAKRDRKSIAAEVIDLLEQFIPTEAELKRREKLFQRALAMSRREPLTPGPFPTTEEMVREDRER